MNCTLLQGDCRELLKTLPDASVNCCVTSPPYWGLRDYGHAGQIGLEKTPGEFVENMVAVFREVRRVLRPDGVLFLNLGDSYMAHPGQRKETDKAGPKQRTCRVSTACPSRSPDAPPCGTFDKAEQDRTAQTGLAL
jgi:predicted methyltransferase